jgi:uncharacterized protein YbbC (DUF1343 family)
MSARVQTGLDRVASGDPAALRLVCGRRLGLLAHPASIDAQLVHAHVVLQNAACDVRVLFGARKVKRRHRSRPIRGASTLSSGFPTRG